MGNLLTNMENKQSTNLSKIPRVNVDRLLNFVKVSLTRFRERLRQRGERLRGDREKMNELLQIRRGIKLAGIDIHGRGSR